MIKDYNSERCLFSLNRTKNRLYVEISEIERTIDKFGAVTQNVLRDQITNLEEEIDCLRIIEQTMDKG